MREALSTRCSYRAHSRTSHGPSMTPRPAAPGVRREKTARVPGQPPCSVSSVVPAALIRTRHRPLHATASRSSTSASPPRAACSSGGTPAPCRLGEVARPAGSSAGQHRLVAGVRTAAAAQGARAAFALLPFDAGVAVLVFLVLRQLLRLASSATNRWIAWARPVRRARRRALSRPAPPPHLQHGPLPPAGLRAVVSSTATTSSAVRLRRSPMPPPSSVQAPGAAADPPQVGLHGRVEVGQRAARWRTDGPAPRRLPLEPRRRAPLRHTRPPPHPLATSQPPRRPSAAPLPRCRRWGTARRSQRAAPSSAVQRSGPGAPRTHQVGLARPIVEVGQHAAVWRTDRHQSR